MHDPHPAATNSKQNILMDEDGATSLRLPRSLILGAPSSILVADENPQAAPSTGYVMNQGGEAAPMGAERGAVANSWRFPRDTESALLVSPMAEDHEILGEIFLHQGWKLYGTGTLESALTVLRERPAPVVITERDLPPADWKDMWEAIQALPQSPLLIVASRLADEKLWWEVLNVGAYDLVSKPFRDTDLLWVLESAWRRGEPT